MIAALLWLIFRPRAAKPAPFARLAWSPSLSQIKAWNKERLDINPALRGSRC